MRFLFSSGVHIDELREGVEKVLGSLERKETLQRNAVVGITSAGAILHRWHNERRYLGSDAKPIPLKLRGHPPSFQSLHRSEGVETPLNEFVCAMMEAGLIRRRQSRYLPTKRGALVCRLNPFAIQHACDVIEGLLSTIANNTDPRRKFTLVERAAIVPNLEAPEFGRFCQFSHAQGSALADAVNDWLERHRAARGRGKRRKTIAVGVHIFAFKQPNARAGHLS
jgi:hypothetical protein